MCFGYARVFNRETNNLPTGRKAEFVGRQVVAVAEVEDSINSAPARFREHQLATLSNTRTPTAEHITAAAEVPAEEVLLQALTRGI
jgi:hypothetical protein